jgi:hypothetical protein
MKLHGKNTDKTCQYLILNKSGNLSKFRVILKNPLIASQSNDSILMSFSATLLKGIKNEK